MFLLQFTQDKARNRSLGKVNDENTSFGWPLGFQSVTQFTLIIYLLHYGVIILYRIQEFLFGLNHPESK